jgi:hypothetical protein
MRAGSLQAWTLTDDYLVIPRNIESFTDSSMVSTILSLCVHLRIGFKYSDEEVDNDLKQDNPAWFKSYEDELIYSRNRIVNLSFKKNDITTKAISSARVDYLFHILREKKISPLYWKSFGEVFPEKNNAKQRPAY